MKKKFYRKRQEIRGRMLTGRQLLVRLLQVGGRGQRAPTLQKPSADLVGLAMVRGGDFLDMVFNRNRLIVTVEGRDRDAPLPVRRTPILGAPERVGSVADLRL